MKTTNNNEQTTITETTLELPIPKAVAGYVMEAFEKNDIKSDFIGIDESGNIMLKVSYFERQEKTFTQIILGMGITEFCNEFLLAVGLEVIVRANAEKN